MEQVYIGLGSNQGDRFQILLECIEKIQSFLKEINYSSVWETEPMIVEDQPPFLNMVVTGFFSGTPDELIRRLWEVEEEAGRNRENERKKGPRPLDLDILLFGDRIIRTDILTVPHPGITERAFVLVPLTEISPAVQNPSNNIPYLSYLETIDGQGYICYKKRDELAYHISRKE